MSSEIVVADPGYDYEGDFGTVKENTAPPTVSSSITFGSEHDIDHHYVPEPFESERLPPTLESGIQRFLRVANLIEREEPRIAYLCRFHAFMIAHYMDRNSSGRRVRQFKTSLLQRVRQFKTSLLQRLEQDERITLRKRKEKSDIRELKRVYHACKDLIKPGGVLDLEISDKERWIHAFYIASVLFEVLEAVTNLVATANSGRFHAFFITHYKDPKSSGWHVQEFKTSLLQRLEQDERITFRKRKEKSDKRELNRVYHAYKDLIKPGGVLDLEIRDKERWIHARYIASVLFEVLEAVTNAVNPQALADKESTHTNFEYNILRLDNGGIQQPIIQQAKIVAAIAAIRNICGLPSVQDFQKRRRVRGCFRDLFDFLQNWFGFQEDNVANQREHRIPLLANKHIRQTNPKTSNSKVFFDNLILTVSRRCCG